MALLSINQECPEAVVLHVLDVSLLQHSMTETTKSSSGGAN